MHLYMHLCLHQSDKGECINQVKRYVQVTLFRLRSQHIQLNQHLNRFGIKTDAQCPLSRCSKESVAHTCTVVTPYNVTPYNVKIAITSVFRRSPFFSLFVFVRYDSI